MTIGIIQPTVKAEHFLAVEEAVEFLGNGGGEAVGRVFLQALQAEDEWFQLRGWSS